MWQKSEWYSTMASTIATRHYFIAAPSPQITITQVNLAGITMNVRKHPYAYSQHMIVLKHFLCIQYGCREEMSGILHPHHINTS